MIHKILRRVRVNFRKSRSDRVATGQYRNYQRSIARFFRRSPKMTGNERNLNDKS